MGLAICRAAVCCADDEAAAIQNHFVVNRHSSLSTFESKAKFTPLNSMYLPTRLHNYSALNKEKC